MTDSLSEGTDFCSIRIYRRDECYDGKVALRPSDGALDKNRAKLAEAFYALPAGADPEKELMLKYQAWVKSLGFKIQVSQYLNYSDKILPIILELNDLASKYPGHQFQYSDLDWRTDGYYLNSDAVPKVAE